MAKEVKLESFKKGDTPIFGFEFDPEDTTFDWTGYTIDCALTSVEAPTDNSGAGASRIGQPLVVDASKVATYDFQLTELESKALAADGEYRIEAQLKDAGSVNVGTPITGKIKVEQDYII